jgi:hypothetical protein
MGSGGFCLPDDGTPFCSKLDYEPLYGCGDARWCDDEVVTGGDGSFVGIGICQPGECVPDGERCDTLFNPTDACCSGVCDTALNTCVQG